MTERQSVRAYAANVAEPDPERKVWLRVLTVAVLGFGVGALWPTVTGVRFGPSAPGESSSAGRAPKQASPEPAAAAAQAVPQAASAAAEPAIVAAQISVRNGFVIDCKTQDGESKKGNECGGLRALDERVVPRLQKLGACQAAAAARGVASVVAKVDFGGRRLDASLGKSTQLSRGEAAEVLTCVKGAIETVDVADLPHSHKSYSIAYKVELSEPGTAPAEPAADSEPSAASGDTSSAETAAAAPTPPKSDTSGESGDSGTEVAVAWDTAILRSAPRTGEIVARLPRGSKVRLLSSESGWWRVKYGANFGSEAWVFRAAIGR